MDAKRIINIGLALFINAGIITACSTNQMPGTVNSQQSNNGTNLMSENSEPSPNIQEQSTLSSEVQANIQDDEMTIQDSEMVAQEQASFSTKAKKEDKADKDNDKKATDEKIKGGLGLGLRTTLAANLGRKQREQILEDREKVLKAQIKLHEAKLKLLKDYKKNNNLKRKNVDVKNSDVVEVKNADGTTSKIITVKFENKTENNTRENKVVKTFSADGKLIKSEHYLTVTHNNYSRTYTKIVEFNADGSKKVVVKSETKWSNGKTRVVNEERNIKADGSGTGTGTVIVTEKDGTTRAYDIRLTITVNGDVSVQPAPTPSPSPSISPTSSPSPSTSVTVSPSPTSTPVPSVSPSAVTSPTPTASVTPNIEVNTTVNVGT